jgi:PAS domain S-box-containing protein
VSPQHGVTEFLSVFDSDRSIYYDIETDLFITLDEGGNIRGVNPAFERVLGYREQDVIDKSLILFIDLQTMKQGVQRFNFLKRGGGDVVCQIVAWKYKHQQHYAIFRRCSA